LKLFSQGNKWKVYWNELVCIGTVGWNEII